jgi:hypothetical protein
MNSESKVWSLMALFIMVTFRTIVDLIDEFYFSIHSNIDENNPYKKIGLDEILNKIKLILDIPFALLTVYLLCNIKYNIKIYLFLFMVIINLISDYFVEVKTNTFGLDKKSIVFIDRYLSLILDGITTIIGVYVLSSIFNVSNT